MQVMCAFGQVRASGGSIVLHGRRRRVPRVGEALNAGTSVLASDLPLNALCRGVGRAGLVPGRGSGGRWRLIEAVGSRSDVFRPVARLITRSHMRGVPPLGQVWIGVLPKRQVPSLGREDFRAGTGIDPALPVPLAPAPVLWIGNGPLDDFLVPVIGPGVLAVLLCERDLWRPAVVAEPPSLIHLARCLVGVPGPDVDVALPSPGRGCENRMSPYELA